jgi:hypothetical protein
VLSKFFPGSLDRKLGSIEQEGRLVGWSPNRPSAWHRKITNGVTLDETEPLILRPALRSERSASWYIEDGSGRGTALVAHQELFGPSLVLAIGYLGRTPDANSSFMRRSPFCELLADL